MLMYMVYVCACRCGPMQVRQCEATVDFTGRDRGHVTSPSHRTASNRTVRTISHTQPVEPSSSVSVCRCQSSGHRCPTLVAELAASEEGGSRTI